MTSETQHWQQVYERKGAEAVSWYRPHLEKSLELIEATGLPKTARIIDVGGGSSTLVDDLLDRGYTNLTVLDLSQAALDLARARLGPRADMVTWLCADVTEVKLSCDAYDIWHDRAVFHFLTSEQDRKAYVERACCSLGTGGFVIVATFAKEGPEKCSGLPVVRYSAAEIQAEFGAPYELLAHSSEVHETPWGSAQEFVYCICNKAVDC